MLFGIGETIIMFMLFLLGVLTYLLIHQMKMMIIEDREFKAYMKGLRNER